MKMVLLMVAALLLPVMLQPAQRPAIDYHQHLLSPSAARLGSLPHTFTARDLIPLLDAAGVERALVLSLAYQYDRVKSSGQWGKGSPLPVIE
jgi:hypothetical protein